jgi:hypothetical protein
MSDPVLPLSDCFPNPESYYFFRGSTAERVRGDDASVPDRLRRLAERGEEAWRAGLEAWTRLPEDLLGTWVRNARNEVRWASRSDIAAYADGIDEAYSRSAGWVRVQIESGTVAPQYEGRSKDFLAWRARHADTARVAWEVPRRASPGSDYDCTPEAMGRFSALAGGLTSADTDTRRAAVLALCDFIGGYGNNTVHRSQRWWLAEAGVLESLAYVVDSSGLCSTVDMCKIRPLLGYLLYDGDAPYASLDRIASRPRARVFSDLILELFLNRVRTRHPDASLILEWIPDLLFGTQTKGPGSINPSERSPAARAMTLGACSEWAEVLHSACSNSPAHLETCFRLLWGYHGSSLKPDLFPALLRPEPADIEPARRLLEHYVDLDDRIRMADRSRCLADAPGFQEREAASGRCDAMLGLDRACKSSSALRAGLLPLSGRLERMLKSWEPARGRFHKEEQLREAMARRPSSTSYRRLDWPGFQMYLAFEELLTTLRTPPT